MARERAGHNILTAIHRTRTFFCFVSLGIDCYKNSLNDHQKSCIRYFTTRGHNERNNELKLSTQESRMYCVQIFFFCFAEIISFLSTIFSDIRLSLNSRLLMESIAERNVVSAKRHNRDSRPRSQFLMPIIALRFLPRLSARVLVNQYTWPAPVWPIVSKHAARRTLRRRDGSIFPEKGWDVNSRKGR